VGREGLRTIYIEKRQASAQARQSRDKKQRKDEFDENRAYVN